MTLIRVLAIAQLGAVAAGCAIRSMSQPVLSLYVDGRDWVLLEPLTFEFTTAGGQRSYVTVPRGFVTDLASAPPLSLVRCPAYGAIHDRHHTA
jgi:hypothetical protein